jgi:eukaryotic-like serine/threonine-protein kinase
MAESEQTVPEIIADRFEVRRQLGRGGMGTVYLVHDRKHKRKMALKTLHRELLDKPWVTARFIREAKATRLLDHPGVVKIFGTYKNPEDLFYTMEYIRGRNLRSYLHKVGHLELSGAVHVLGMLSRALDYTHGFTIHRDISPENIMVQPDGVIKLIDFGLARLNDDEEELTIAETGLGKAQYHAPEQGTNASTCDHRADIYPLGVILFELLTHKRPDGELRLTKLLPNLPPSCDALAMRTLAEDPAERFPSAREFHNALLDVYMEHKEFQAKRPFARLRKVFTIARPFKAIRWLLPRRADRGE